jgi:drug/metabolite transporter (DMT)-like permease
MLRRRALAYLALLLAVFIWGVNFLVVEKGVRAWTNQKCAFLAARFWLAFLVYAGIVFVLRMRGRKDSSKLPWSKRWQALMVGVVLAAGYGFQTWYLETRTAVSASFLTSTTVLWAAVIAFIFFRETVHRSTFIGALTAFAGIILIEWPTGPVTFKWVSAFGLFAAIAFAIEILLVSRFAPADQSLEWTMISCLGVAVLMTVISLASNLYAWVGVTTGPSQILSLVFQGIYRSARDPSRIFAVAFTGTFATAVALGLQNWAQAQKIGKEPIIDGPRAAIISTLEPVFTSLAVGILILLKLQAPISAPVALGCALILCGTVLSELAAAKRRQRQSKSHDTALVL